MIHLSPTGTTTPRTLIDALDARAQDDGDESGYVFVDDDGQVTETLSFRELRARACSLGAVLREMTAPGDRALITAPPGLEYVVAFYACIYAGLVAVPAFPLDALARRRGTERIRAIAADASAAIALTTSSVLAQGGIGLDDPRVRVVSTDAGDRPDPEAWRRPACDPTSVALLQYTSGSTTSPRGVVLTHENMLVNAVVQRRAWRLSKRSVNVSWLPLYHDLGVITCLIQPITTGCRTIMMSPLTFMRRPVRWLQTIAERRGSFAGGPNFAFELCVRKTSEADRRQLDLSSWSCAFNGAEPIRAETLEAFAEAFAPSGFRPEALYPCFGLAEANFVSGGLAPGARPVVRRFDRQALAAGLAIPTYESPQGRNASTLVGCGAWQTELQDVRIVSTETGTPCAEGSVGEIWVGGSSVAMGYWGRPAESEEVFGAQIEGGRAPRYLRTGDLGFVSDDELFITGRAKDLVIVRGVNHYPQDIEMSVERAHVGLRKGCGAAFSVDVGGQERLVIVHEFDGDPRLAPEVMDSIRGIVAEAHDLHVDAIGLVVVGAIRKTTSGKIQRKANREAWLGGTLDMVASWLAPERMNEAGKLPAGFRAALPPSRGAVERWLVERLALRLNVARDALDVTQPLARYGLDSRHAVELSADLEDWLGKPVAATIAYAFPTIELLAAHLGADAAADARSHVPDPGRRPTAPEPIAVVGIGCRVPGASGPTAYWQLLRDGVDTITETPASRWDARALFDPDPRIPGRMASRWGGFLDAVDRFDPLFFGMSPREATHLDPQQRLILEVAWEALEDAGIPSANIAGTRTGVFVGVTTADYGKMLWARPCEIDSFSATGTLNCIVANRLSYVLDLRGPSLSIDTACSASLVSIHEACQSLWSGESTMALAGGVNVILTPENTISQTKLGGMASDGRCKAFDARADGIVRGEGAGIVVLKRLSRALLDGDRIRAVIRGTAVNQDGRSNGLTAPNPEAQESVLREAYRHAAISPGVVQYVEAHGTGTRLGDPIEAHALGAVLAEGRAEGTRCAIGSAKTNFGHLESAAGVIGFIKVVLSLEHRQIPPSLHYASPNPEIHFDSLPLAVQTTCGAWPAGPSGRIGGVSSFGMGGTNAHVVLSEAPERKPLATPTTRSAPALVLVSARSPEALREQCAALAESIVADDDRRLEDIAYTSALRRDHHDYRLAAVVATKDELRTALEAHSRGDATAALTTGVRRPGAPPRIAFVFSGHGSQHGSMARGLMADDTAFASALGRCDAALLPILGWSVRERLVADEPTESDRVDLVQPILFAVQVALAETWRARGVVPGAIVGHSLGEVAAAHVAGALTLDDAARVVALRSRLLRRLSGKGAMAVVRLSLGDAVAAIESEAGKLSAAISNSPTSTVISGEPDALGRVVATLTAREVFCRPIRADGAGHCYLVDPLLPEMVNGLDGLRPMPTRIPFYSSVTGELTAGAQLGPGYWARALREPVVFAMAVRSLVRDGCDTFVEISPHPLLTTPVQQCLDHAGSTGTVVASLRRDEPDGHALLRAAGVLHTLGGGLDLATLPHATGRLVDLPHYAWQRQRYWLEPSEHVSAIRAGAHPLLARAMHSALGDRRWHWELDVSPSQPTFVRDHELQGEFPFASLAFAEMALAGAIEAFGKGRYSVSDLSFVRALFTSTEEPRTIQLILTPDGLVGGRFEIVSRAEAGDEGTWTRHVTGRIERAGDSVAEPLGDQRRTAIQAACSEAIDGAAFYEALRGDGLNLGPRFRAITRLWRRDGEALAEVVTPISVVSESDGYRMHPGLLDACAQALLVTNAKTRPFMPVAIRSIRIYAAPTGKLWSHARRIDTTEPGVLRGDVRVYADDGSVVADIADARLRYLDEATSRGFGESPKDWRYEIVWRNFDSSTPQKEGDVAPGRWLVFADLAGSGAAVVKALRSTGDQCLVVQVGEGSGVRMLDAVGARPSSVPEVRSIVAGWLDTDDPLPVRGVVYLWALDALGNDGTDLARARDLGCTAAIAVFQEVGARSETVPIWLITRRGVAIGARDGAPVGAQAALWGAARTLSVEYATVQSRLLDVDPHESAEECAHAVLDLLQRHGVPDEIARRDGRWLEPRLVRAEVPATVIRHSVAWRPDATYLVVGGLGGIGLVVARWMVEQGARRLLLLGRTGLPERSVWRTIDPATRIGEQIAAVRAMEALGASVHIVAVDVGDADALSACLDAFERDGWPSIRGVLHAASASNLRPAAMLDNTSIDVDFGPKVRGVCALDRWLGARPLDFFVAFTSLTSVLPSPFLTAYAAANAFVDALLAERRAHGYAGAAIQWGMWADVGLSARLAREKASTDSQSWAVGALSPEQGLDAFNDALERRDGQIAIARMDWAKYSRTYPRAGARSILRELTAATTATVTTHVQSLGVDLRSLSATARRTYLLGAIATIASRILRLGDIRLDPNQALDTLGLDSLMAAELRNAVASEIGVAVPIVAFLRRPTIEQIVGRIESVLADARAERAADLVPVPVSRHGDQPLSSSQQGMWYLDQLAPGSTVYFMTLAYRLKGAIDLAAVGAAIDGLVAQHEALRTTFPLVDGRPVQRIAAPAAPVPVERLDVSGVPETEREAALAAWLSSIARRGVDLASGPLFRIAMARVSDGDHVLAFGMHHILSDGWSVRVIVEEFVERYGAYAEGHALTSAAAQPMQLVDFVAWQQQMLAGPEGKRLEAYWCNALAGAPTRLALPTDRARPEVQAFRGATVPVALPPGLLAQVGDLARAEGATPFMGLFAALAVVLGRHAGQDDFVLGTPVANRGASGFERTVGFLNNMLPLRAQLGGDPTFRELLARIRDTVHDAFAHQDLPLADIIRALGVPRETSHAPLFQVEFALQPSPMSMDLPGFARSVPEIVEDGTARFDLYFDLFERDGTIAGSVEYDCDLFDRATVERIVSEFAIVLSSATAQPDDPISRVALLDDQARRTIVERFNDTRAAYPDDVFVHRLIEAQASWTPTATAVVFGDTRVTYAELDARASRLGRALVARGVGPDVLVGLFFERSIEMVVAIVAVLKAGGAYVPIDPEYPEARIEAMLADAAPRVVLTHSQTREAWMAIDRGQSTEVLCLDTDEAALVAGLSAAPIEVPGLEPHHLAYVIFTSGSTGRPKGAMNTHHGLTNRLMWMQEALGLDVSDRVLQKTPYSFDVSVWEFLWPLMVGATLVVAEPGGHRDPSYLRRLIVKEAITTLHFVPSMLEAFLADERTTECVSLTRVVCSGEALSYDLKERFLARSRAELFNLYGPTEASIDVTAWACRREGPQGRAIVPIGRPIANSSIYILDTHGVPTPIGVAGEIHIGGRGVGRGYWKRSDLTAAAFVPDPFAVVPGARMYRTGDLARWLPDGAIEYLGRRDHQVKVRGVRIELGEIEEALRQHPSVRDCVIAVTGASDDRRLVAYWVPVHDTKLFPGVDAFRAALRRLLPDAMVPTVFVRLDALPLSPNGKVDRGALPSPQTAESTLETHSSLPPRDELEALLADAFATALRVPRVGVEDDFFVLGGHSLLAARLAIDLGRRLGRDVPLGALVKAPNVAMLAALLRGGSGAACSTDDLSVDSCLDPAIRPAEGVMASPAEAANVLLTGATGFVGGFLLDELIRETDSTVYCLVRAPTISDGRERLTQALGQLGLSTASAWRRIVPVCGDLSLPRLGLTEKVFDDLARTVGAVYHSGAVVNHVRPYDALRPANVTGTSEVLRFAVRHGVKPVHYLSTIAVLSGSAHRVLPVIHESPLDDRHDDLPGSYAKTKWVAERLMTEAAARGVPITIYRLGQVTGDTLHGTAQTGDFVARFLRGCLELGATITSDMPIDLLPVDFVARAIVGLSRRPSGIACEVVHLVPPAAPSWRTLLGMLRNRGYHLDELPFEGWYRALLAAARAGEENALVPYIAMIDEAHPVMARVPRFDTARAGARLAACGIKYPPIDDAYVSKLLAFYVASGVIHEPPATESARTG